MNVSENNQKNQLEYLRAFREDLPEEVEIFLGRNIENGRTFLEAIEAGSHPECVSSKVFQVCSSIKDDIDHQLEKILKEEFSEIKESIKDIEEIPNARELANTLKYGLCFNFQGAFEEQDGYSKEQRESFEKLEKEYILLILEKTLDLLKREIEIIQKIPEGKELSYGRILYDQPYTAVLDFFQDRNIDIFHRHPESIDFSNDIELTYEEWESLMDKKVVEESELSPIIRRLFEN